MVTVEEKEQEEEGLIVEKEEVPVVAVEEEEQEEVRELIKSKFQQLKAFARAVGQQGKSGLNKLATGFTARTVRYAFNFYHLISNLILSFFQVFNWQVRKVTRPSQWFQCQDLSGHPPPHTAA